MEAKKEVEFLGIKQVKGQTVVEFSYKDAFGFYIRTKQKLNGAIKVDKASSFWDRQNTSKVVKFADVPDANEALHKAYQIASAKLKEAQQQEAGQLKLL